MQNATTQLARKEPQIKERAQPEVTLLTGCKDPHYAFGLTMTLAEADVRTEVIGSDFEDNPEFHRYANVSFRSLRRNRQSERSFGSKLRGWLLFYWDLLRYVIKSPRPLVHILWNNKFELFDRTFLMVVYKLLRKKIVCTVHNVNQARRDSHDSVVNRFTLRIQYHLADHLFVHTDLMKHELCTVFGVRPTAVTVIPYGINNAIPNSSLSCAAARQQMAVKTKEKTILFYGGIKPYKGLEYLVEAFRHLEVVGDYRLIIAGERKKEAEQYFNEIQRKIQRLPDPGSVIQRIEYIPDKDTEVYFKAADVIALPYKEIFQSGILFLAYSFGLPAVASDVGSFRDDIIEGMTGFLCKPDDAKALASAIERYFNSDLFMNLPARRAQIQAFAKTRHCWDVVGRITQDTYTRLLADL